MLLREVAYCRPVDVEDALAVLREHPGARPLAGGQTLVNVLKLRAASVDALVDISGLEELRLIRRSPDGGLEIGACVTYDELEHSEEVGEAVPILAEVASHTVDQQVRNRGTIGGNCCYADPASNYPPLMTALGTTMRVATPAGEREVAAEEFVLGFSRTAVGTGELLRSVVVPPLDGSGVGYQSLLIGRDSWALARAVAVLRAEPTIVEARVVLGCVADAPLRQPAVEQRLRGRDPSPETLAEASRASCEGIEPISDVHASGGYRRRMSRVVVRRALEQAIEEAE
jgi:aerobic carbon-monoxide dehydrogenase medium subunit